MSFFKRRGKSLLIVFFSIFLMVQGMALSYGRAYRAQSLVDDEISHLNNIWRKASPNDIITPQKIADRGSLELARFRLKEAETEFQASQKRLDGTVVLKDELFQKVYTYYHNAILALLVIVDFLLTKDYSVHGMEVNFVNEEDGKKFCQLIGQFSNFDQEKQRVEALILQRNKN